MDPNDPDATRRQADAREYTQRIEGAGRGWDAEHEPTSGPYATPPEHEAHRGRDLAFVALGAVLGAFLAVIGIALGTTPGTDAGTDDRVEELQSALEERDAQLAERETEIEGLRAELDDGQDTSAREAELDERRASLDERAAALDERAATLDDREADLEARERAIEDDGEDPGPSPDGDTPGEDGPDGESLTEQAETIVDRVLEGIRELFGQAE